MLAKLQKYKNVIQKRDSSLWEINRVNNYETEKQNR